MPVISFTQNKVTFDKANPNVSVSTTGSGLSLLWGNNSVFGFQGGGGVAGFTGGGDSTFYTTPRVGFDYVFLPNWTIGGILFVFFTLGKSQTVTTGNVSRDVSQPSANAVGIAPRVGYISGSARCSRSGCAAASRIITPERASRTAPAPTRTTRPVSVSSGST